MGIDEKILEAGVYSFSDLQSLGFVKDRTDLLRKKKKYGFPRPLKLGERQAGFLRAEVHSWVRDRVADRRLVIGEKPPPHRNGRRLAQGGRPKWVGGIEHPSHSPVSSPRQALRVGPHREEPKTCFALPGQANRNYSPR